MSQPRTQIILWRHGQTDHNVENRFQGQTDVPLNQVGRAQAAQAAEVLAQFEVDAIVSSPLQRTMMTVALLAERLGLPVATDERLMEVSCGSWEGLLASQIERDHPEFFQSLAAGRDARRSTDGETGAEVGRRVGAVLRQIAGDHPGQTVVVGCHGLAIRMGVADLLGWDYATSTSLVSLPNCAWATLVVRSAGTWKLAGWNQQGSSRPS